MDPVTFNQYYSQVLSPTVYGYVAPPADRFFYLATGTPLQQVMKDRPDLLVSGSVLGGAIGGVISRIMGGSFSTGFLIGSFLGPAISVNIAK